VTETLDRNAAETPPNPAAIPAGELARMTDDIVAALKTVYDPEIPVDILNSASSTRSISTTTAMWRLR
jgi:hypothetical protein